MKKYKPTRGRAIVEFEDHHANVREAGFIVPGIADDRRDSIGTVIDIRYKKGAFPGVGTGDIVIVPTYVAGTKIGDGREIINIEDIAAVISGEGELDVSANTKTEIPRCRLCGPADAKVSSNGVFLESIGPNGEMCCPRCQRDANGVIPTDYKPTDEDVEDLRQAMGARE